MVDVAVVMGVNRSLESHSYDESRRLTWCCHPPQAEGCLFGSFINIHSLVGVCVVRMYLLVWNTFVKRCLKHDCNSEVSVVCFVMTRQRFPFGTLSRKK